MIGWRALRITYADIRRDCVANCADGGTCDGTTAEPDGTGHTPTDADSHGWLRACKDCPNSATPYLSFAFVSFRLSHADRNLHGFLPPVTYSLDNYVSQRLHLCVNRCMMVL